MKKFLALLLLSCLSIAKLSAQVTGTKVIGTDYATLAAAIADLNTYGISGNVIINVPTGYTETAPAGGYLLGSATLNASTSATSTLTIQKSGATANPLLTAPVGTSASVDGIFFIQGTDYVTIDGIDLTESAANTTANPQMEFGYALVKRQAIAPFDGCQNVTIKNCTITLTILYTASIGIYANNHTATSASLLTITAPTDAMNNCVFSSNTIQNCNTGMRLIGYAGAASPYTLYDQNNTVGGGSTAGNTIQNYGANAVILQYQNNDAFTYNTINNIAGGGTVGTGGGVGVNVGPATNASVNVSNNTINLSIGATAGNTYGIYINSAGTGTINLDANTLTASGGGTGGFYMIFFASGNTNMNVTNNNFSNINVATTGALALIMHSLSASTFNMYCNGNYTSGSAAPYVTKTGSGGTFYGYNNPNSSTAGTTTISNNNFSNITLTGATTFIGIYESNANTVNAGMTKYVFNNVVSNISTAGVSAVANYGIAVGGASASSISNCQVSNMNVGIGNGYAIYHWACTTDTIRNCRVNGLTTTGGNVYGITTSNTSTTTRIYADTISGLSSTFATGAAYGIYQSGAVTAEIYKNTLYDIAATGSGGAAYGIYLASNSNTVWNNLVADIRTPNYTTATANSGTQLVGIYCNTGTAHNIFYNTVYLNGTSTGANFGSSAVYAATANTTFNNNIFINNSIPAGTGIVAAYRRSAAGLTGYMAASNNNLFYAGTPSANTVIMYDGATAYQTLAAYKTLVTPRDAASVTENVNFQSVTGGTPGFLKPSTTIATQVESNGINIAGITDDFFGTVRAGNAGYAGAGVTPDLGAVEADYIPLDLSAPGITYTSLTSTCATGNRTVTATITDVTGVPVTGTLMPRIYYKKGSGSWFSSAGVLASGTGTSGTWTFTILASDMSGVAGGDVISYFVIAQDSAATPNIGSIPVGVAATDVNTIGTYPAILNTYSVLYTLGGSYNVGTGGDFTTITAAANAYNTACLTGPVVFDLISATYPSETFPITLTGNAGASAINTLTIRPATAMSPTITGSGAPVFTLDGAQYVTIDGRAGGTGTTKALTISNTTTNAANIRLVNGANYDTLKYCTLVNVNTATNTGTIFFTTSAGATGNSNNLIDNCDFSGGATPYVQGVYSSGTAGKENINNTVSNCNFANYFSATVATCGINLSTANSGWTITANRFYQTTAKTYTTTNTHRAILINSTSGNGFTVTNNIIGYSSATGTGTYSMTGTVATTFNGIEMSVGTTTPSSVQGNTITNISLAGTSGTHTGIYISGGSVNAGTIAGNTIGATTGTGAITVTNTASVGNIVSGMASTAPSPAIVNFQNNIIGGITVTGSGTIGAGVTGISLGSTGTVNVSGNTIGSTTTANSINSSAVTASSVSMVVYGINSSLTSASTISNNTVANINCAATSNLAFVSGIIHTGSGALTISGNTIRNVSGAGTTTQLAGQVGVNGIAVTNGSVTVSQNTISTIMNTNATAVQSNVAGIGLTTSANASILRNRVYDLRNASIMAVNTTPPTAIGILIGNPGAGITTIANNMISLGNGQGSNTEFMGIMNSTTSTSTLKVYHNTINIEGAAASGALPTMGFNRGNNTTTAITTPIEFKNNIIRNARTGGTGKHYAIVNGILVVAGSATGWVAGASNNNILNAAAATVGFWSTDQTLAGWRTTSAGDANSYSGVTATFSNTATGDLHMSMGTTPNFIESHATAVGITNDYDNDARPGPVGSVNGGGVLPDIGADEFDGVSTDDVAPAITYTILPGTCSTSDRTLTATIIDQSGVPVAGSGTEPRVYYKKGLAGTWYSRPGTLTSGTVINGTWSFPIVGADMGGISGADRVYYYVAAQDVNSTPNVGANPGTGFAATSVNAVTTPPATPNNYFVGYGSGTFNVGVGQPFTTITEAVNSYNTNTCLTGPVTFLLTDATYAASETFPITINSNALASSSVTLTIKPAPGVAATVTGTATAASVFKLLNAQFVTIDGLNTGGSSLTLNNSNIGTSAVVWLASTVTTGPGNKNISLLNMNMNGGLNTLVSNWGIIAGVDGAAPAGTNGPDNDSVTVQGNFIKKCGYSMWLAGTAATAAGGLNGWVIRNNILGPSSYSATENLGVNGLFMRNMTNVIYSGNTLQNVGFTTTTNGIAGIYMEAGIDGIVIDSNIVDSVMTAATSAPSVWAYYLGGSVKNATISRNKISSVYSMNTGGYGARGITVTNATAASNVNIVNNFISDVVSYSSTTVANWPIGISVEGTSGGVNIYHNSINLFGTHPGLTSATGSADILITTTGIGIDVRNNLLVNSYENTSSSTDKTYAIYSSAANTVYSNIDYNNYYTTGGTPMLGYIGGDRPTLTDMITGFGGNTHSINEPAPFVSSTDLHIPVSTITPLESAGIAIAGITTDIDNQVRPGPVGSTYGGGTIPDIGADEFDGVPIDGSAPLVSYTAMSTSTCATGDRLLSGVTISDFTGVPITGTLMPRIYFRKNTGSWVSDTGTKTGGTATNGTWSFTISATALGGLTGTDVVSYYVIAQDIVAVPNVAAFPGAGLVASDVNTVTTAPTTPYTYTVVPTLSGPYTVGSGGAYPTITAAVNAYNSACLAGDVTFLLTDATYSTGETFPIVIRNNAYASSSATLTIRPQAGVSATVTGTASAGSVFKLLNARYITIDGLNTGGSSLTLNNSNTGTSAVVWLASTVTTGPGNKNISLLNMNMNGGLNTNVSNWGIIAGVDGATPSATNGMDNDSVTVQGNYIKKCGYSLYLMGTAATAAGGLNGWVIKNNILGPSTYSATENLCVNGTFMRNMTNVVFSGNTLQNIGHSSVTGAVVGMYFEAGVDGMVIDSNIVDTVIANTTSGYQVCAFYFNTGNKNITISRNKIAAMYNVNTGGYGARGIVVTNGIAASNFNIVNNFISDVVNYSSATLANWAAGISVDGTSGGVNIYHNSINLSGAHPGLTTATGSADILITTTGTGFDVRNNILVNSYENSSSTTDKTYAIYSSAASTAYTNIDYNNYYTTGGTPILGYVGGTDRPALADMITGFGGNTHSIHNATLFMSSNDLHLQPFSINVPLISGTPLAAVTTDIDGNTRGTTPVIGADEVNIPPCTGTPTPGTVTASVLSSCGTFNSNLTLTGSSTGAGITLQWQSSADSSTWANITGATDLTYNPSVTVTTYYRVISTCTISTLTDVTPGLKLISHTVPTITGAAATCVGGSITLSVTPAGGTWVSGATSTATIDPATGVATGAAIGTAPITYTSTVGCVATRAVAVVSAPSIPLITPATATICDGGSVSMVAAATYSGIATNGTATLSIPVPATVDGYYNQLAVSVPAGATITSASVYFNISTTYVGDIAINLTAPNGNTLNLFNRYGGAGDNFVNTVVSSTATVPISTGAAPYTGTYSASAILSATSITGFPVNVTSWTSLLSAPSGVWTLSVRDNVSADPTSFNSWGITLNYTIPSDVTWSPTGTLYTDAALSTPYTGTVTNTIYAKPSAPGTVTTVNTYTATASIPGCAVTSDGTAVVTVNPLPENIVGANTVCVGSTTTLTNGTSGGTWTSSVPATASVGSATGIVTGVAAGVVTMTYANSVTGCYKTLQMTVNPLPAAIAGTSVVCEAATTTLADADAAGVWSSDAASVATVGSGTGIVTGVTAGFVQITYTLPTTCKVSQQVTVNPTPVMSVTPTPVPDICFGATTSLAANATMNNFALMSQDFNAGLGAWTITNIDGNTASYWQLTASPGYSGTTGDGSQMIEAAPDAYMGITHVRFTSPSFSTVGYGAVTLSFNEYLLSLSSSDDTVAIEYSTDGGTVWNTVLDQVDNIIGGGSWLSSSPEVSVALPAGAVGQPGVMLRWNYYSNQGLWWAVDNIKVSAAHPAPSFTWSGVSGATGLSCTACTSVDVTPASSGANEYSVMATTSAGCANSISAIVTVNPLPSTIGGTLVVCQGDITSATDVDAGGTWSIAATSIATVDATTGAVTGVSAGTAEITYTLPTGCTTTAIVTVNPLPALITGVMQVCEGLTTTLSDVTTGGTWSSSSTHASVDAAGVVTGITAGVETITFQLPTSCISTADVTVNPTPAAITGTMQVCEGLTTTLSSTFTGGTWVSSSTATASIDITTGVVTGVMDGVTTITYQLPEGCTTTADVTVNPLPALITGVMQVCEGLTTTLGDVTTGGTWSSSSTHASIDAAGIVTGITAGVETITYQLPTTCISTADVTVNPTPAAITGVMQVCEGLTTTLSSTSTGGTWVSSSTATASIDITTGVVTGVTDGVTTITYQLPEGCTTTADVTVNPLPALITGVMQVCEGLTTTLGDITIGGTWSSSSTHASVDAAGVVTGITAGVETITFQLATSCISTADVTVNPTPAAITGMMQVCEGLTTILSSTSTGGTWVSSATGTASVDVTTGIVTGVMAGVATITYQLPEGCTTTADVTVNPLPAPITGTMQVCEGLTATLGDVTTGGNWSSSSTHASVDAAGIVTGITAGVETITYQLPTSCLITADVTVNPTPAAITGIMQVCEGLTTTLSSTSTGGTWASGAAGTASVGATTGVVTGVMAGVATITYQLPEGCTTTADVTVNPLPAAITGVMQVCEGLTTTVSSVTGGGTWSGGTAGIATIDASGVVSGIAAGSASVTYTIATGCLTSAVVTVNPLPATIGGTAITCIGVTTTLNNAVTGGAWSSGAAGIATVGSATGIVSGVSAGIAPITYTLSTGCYTSTNVTVNGAPAVITGTPRVCIGSATTLSDSDPGGAWVSAAPAIASVSASGVVSGVTMGTATISYMLSAGCVATTVVTIDPLPAPITGPSQLCVGATGAFTNGTSGGTWTSSTPLVATIDITTGAATAMGAGTTIINYTSAAGCVRSRVLTVNALPASITGPSQLCKGSTITLADATAGGTWSSGDAAVATINSAGVLTGVADGMTSITYTQPTGCTAMTIITVNPLPSAISGITNVCQGQTTTLSNTVAGGTWISGANATAPVNPTTGVVTGVGVGSAFISYTLPSGCGRSIAVAVSAMPAPIAGTTSVCQGTTTTMTTSSAGGVWTSSTTSVASIGLTTGVVTGLAAGITSLSYTMAGGCSVTYTITVEPIPAAFTGSLAVCYGQSATLSSSTTGGTWTSSNAAVASVAVGGIVSGVSAGTAVISYVAPSGCTRTAVMTVNALPAVHNVTGGGNYCAGGSGVHIGLDNSDGGVLYQLYSGTGALGGPVAGISGVATDFGVIAPTGTYSVVAASPATGCSNNMSGSATVTVAPVMPASVSFASSTGSYTVCSGAPVTFTASPINGGTAPAYQWRINGSAITGATNNTYSYTPATGDVVSLNMSSSVVCATPSVATTSATIVVNAAVMPVASMVVTPGASVCLGSSATFSASALHGGTLPVFIWMKNGGVAAFGPTYTYTPANGDNVYVKLAGNYPCALADTVISSAVTMTVSPIYTPMVNIAATPGTVIQVGTHVTLTASVTNAGPSPEYQWYIGPSAIAGATSSVFSYSMFADGDSVTCTVKGTGGCGLNGFNSVIMHVGGVGVQPGATISDIRLIPNPNKGEFVVKGTVSVTSDMEVDMEITNMLGQVVYRTKAIAHNGNIETRIRLDNTLANGMYMLNLRSANENKIFHFVLEQ